MAERGREENGATEEQYPDTLEPVSLPIDGVLDLHTFRPSDTADLVTDYIDECLRSGITQIRIIHGKGTGAQRLTVEATLKRHPRVAHFQTADEGAGGWGATLVNLC